MLLRDPERSKGIQLDRKRAAAALVMCRPAIRKASTKVSAKRGPAALSAGKAVEGLSTSGAFALQTKTLSDMTPQRDVTESRPRAAAAGTA